MPVATILFSRYTIRQKNFFIREVEAVRLDQKIEERRLRYKAMAGVFEFFGVIGSALLIIALIALLVTMGAWLADDLSQSFSALQQGVTDALIVK